MIAMIEDPEALDAIEAIAESTAFTDSSSAAAT